MFGLSFSEELLRIRKFPPRNLLVVFGTNPFARAGIQISTDQYKDPFLSSVIPMVAPTWCHRAIGGNPFVGD